ncbi:MAG TPA: MBL fold metallo-hydrolase [Euryarchaeota archaeon]|nr:MBL fold metallo-hydrolase [Euryarchaeota archaeon]
MISLIFLGTGGGRFATISQARATGGMYVHTESARMHIDPGPGALMRLRSCGIDPTKTRVLAITHCHPDHYADAEILIEAMTHGCKRKRGLIAASSSVLRGYGDIGPAVSKYHSSLAADCVLLEPAVSLEIDHIRLSALKTFHSDPTGIGLRLESPDGVISITGDTSLKEELYEEHRGCDVLIMSVTRPLKARIPYHLCTEDAAMLASSIKPKMSILTHFGMRLIKKGPASQASWIEKQTGIRTVAAWDGMPLLMRNGAPSVQKSVSRQLQDAKSLSVDLEE